MVEDDVETAVVERQVQHAAGQQPKAADIGAEVGLPGRVDVNADKRTAELAADEQRLMALAAAGHEYAWLCPHATDRTNGATEMLCTGVCFGRLERIRHTSSPRRDQRSAGSPTR